MKRVYVNEQWCLGCHLSEYNCAFANSGQTNIVKALKGKPIFPRIHVEGEDKITSLIREQTPLHTVNFEILKREPALIAFCEENRRKKLGGVV